MDPNEIAAVLVAAVRKDFAHLPDESRKKLEKLIVTFKSDMAEESINQGSLQSCTDSRNTSCKA